MSLPENYFLSIIDMRYFGSKVSSVEKLHKIISGIIPQGSLCDPFGGIGTIGSYFKTKGYSVWTGDILTFTHYFQIARVKLNRMPSFKKIREKLNLKTNSEVIELLNSINPIDDWITDEYSKNRKFFTRQNAPKIDACRLLISDWTGKGWLSNNEKAFLLSSLIDSMDRVANTAGTYYAYLKSWNIKALNPFQFKPIACNSSKSSAVCFHGDAKSLVRLRDYDVLYLDPPYNERSYAHYYHLPEAIALQEVPTPHGKSGISNNIKVISKFNNRDSARQELIDLLEQARFRLLMFHYTDDGLISHKELRNIFRAFGSCKELTIDSVGYKTANYKGKIKQRLYLITHA
jgi:adenine-specific DNA-methyltransferase